MGRRRGGRGGSLLLLVGVGLLHAAIEGVEQSERRGLAEVVVCEEVCGEGDSKGIRRLDPPNWSFDKKRFSAGGLELVQFPGTNSTGHPNGRIRGFNSNSPILGLIHCIQTQWSKQALRKRTLYSLSYRRSC